MHSFTVDPRDSYAQGTACPTCCCQPAFGRPGETNLWSINYAPWSVPIGGPGLACGTEFEIEMTSTCPSSSSDPEPSNTDYFLPIVFGAGATAGTVATNAAPSGGSFTYSRVPLAGPYKGTVEVNADGTYSYTPNGGYVGYDSFWYQMEDDQKRTKIYEVQIQMLANGQVVGDAIQKPFTPAVRIPRDRVNVNSRLHMLQFPVEISPRAQSCENFRITVKQSAVDCNRGCYSHISCYDLKIGTC